MKRSRAFRSEVESLDGRCLPSAAISISDVALAEGHSGQTAFVFTVRLSEASSKPVSVRYATEDGTAKIWDRDYTSVSGKLRFAPGETVNRHWLDLVHILRKKPSPSCTWRNSDIIRYSKCILRTEH